MGILYTVVPLEGRIRGALPGLGVHRVPCDDGRNPTPAEIRSVLADLDGYKVTYSDPPTIGCTWQAMVEYAHDPENKGWTLLNATEYRGADAPTEIWFEKGSTDLVVRILVRLAAETGPLVLFADCGGPPLIIRGDDEPSELHRTWQLDEHAI